MIAEPAAAPGATGASQSNQNGAVTSQAPPTPEPLSTPIGDLAPELEMLELLNVPAEVLERARQGVKEQETQRETAAAAAPAAAAPVPSPGAPAGGEGADELTPEQRKNTDPKLLARIDKLTGRIRGDLEPKLAEKDAEIARLKALVPPAPGEPAQQQQQPPAATNGDRNPYANLKDEAEIANHVRISRGIRDWALMNLEGAFDVPIGKPEAGKTKSFTAAEVRTMLIEANHALETHLPERQQQLHGERQIAELSRQAEEVRPRYEAMVAEEYPDLSNPESELSRSVELMMEAWPALKASPDGRMVAADVASKTIARRDKLVKAGLIPDAPRKAAAAAPASSIDPQVAPFLTPQPPRAPAVPATANGAPPPQSTDAENDKARADFLASPRTDEDYVKFVEELGKGQSRQTNGIAPARV